MVNATHRVNALKYIENSRARVSRELRISEAACDEMHYELAYEWFSHNGYLEFTARVFLLSPSFHTWWNQQVAVIEDEFIMKYGRHGFNPELLKSALEQSIISMNVIPSRELRRKMHNEGMEIIAKNPGLKLVKIYRHGANTDL